MTQKSSTKVLLYFETANIPLSFFSFFLEICRQINPIYFIPPSQMTQKSNRTCFEEIFDEEDEYRLF